MHAASPMIFEYNIQARRASSDLNVAPNTVVSSTEMILISSILLVKLHPATPDLERDSSTTPTGLYLIMLSPSSYSMIASSDTIWARESAELLPASHLSDHQALKNPALGMK